MNDDNNYSDEQLQAFADDEIDIIDRAEMMEAIRRDHDLACQVCELLQIKDAVRLAYREPELVAPRQDRLRPAWWARLPRMAAAAVMIFALGTLTGTLIPAHMTETANQGFDSLAKAGSADRELKRVVLHVSSAEEERLEQALNDAEELLERYKDNPKLIQLEVVANSAGLALLRADTSPYPERIRRLAEKFDNIGFLACSRTIEKLRLRGIDVHLLPEARVIPGALEAIVDRLQQGWVYIRV
jgi:intracellular sulfur oxidation DsrE/DsrF family protein